MNQDAVSGHHPHYSRLSKTGNPAITGSKANSATASSSNIPAFASGLGMTLQPIKATEVTSMSSTASDTASIGSSSESGSSGTGAIQQKVSDRKIFSRPYGFMIYCAQLTYIFDLFSKYNFFLYTVFMKNNSCPTVFVHFFIFGYFDTHKLYFIKFKYRKIRNKSRGLIFFSRFLVRLIYESGLYWVDFKICTLIYFSGFLKDFLIMSVLIEFLALKSNQYKPLSFISRSRI